MRQSKNSSIHVILALLVLLQPIFGADFSVSYNGSVYLHHPQNYTYDLIGDHTVILFSLLLHIPVNRRESKYKCCKCYRGLSTHCYFQTTGRYFVIPSSTHVKQPVWLSNYRTCFRFSYDFVSRTLCPSTIILDHPGNETEQITVELSSSMTDPKKAPFYYLTLDVVHNFVLE